MQLSNFYNYFIPGKSTLDDREYRKHKLIVSVSFVSALYALGYFPLVIMEEYYLAAPIIVFFVCGTSLLPFLLKNKIPLTLIANLYILILCLSEIAIMAVSGGVYHSATDPQLLVLMPVIALLFINRKVAIIWLITGMIIISVIGILQMYGVEFIPQMNSHYIHFQGMLATAGHLLMVFLVINIFENLKNEALDNLEAKNQDIQWQKAMAEAERRKAIESEKFKQQFLANMSHEIRTPMNAILGLTNVLIEKNPGSKQLHELEIIKSSSESLSIIINDILDISKIEAGRLELEEIAFEPEEIIKTISGTFELKAKEKGLDLVVNYDRSIPAVLVGDPTRLNQILLNLVSNAIKFTEKGKVDIAVERDGDGVKFSVSDTGIGLTKEQLKIIFEPFRQADAGTTRKYGGTGLGLSISKELIRLHNSELLVESERGKGSRFSFTVKYPTAEVHALQQKDTEVTPAMIEALKGLRILLAEDNEFNQVVAIETLELKIPGVIITVAENGKEAIEKLTGNDVVLMDMQMPVMDGFEATRRIRAAAPPLNKIPIIALTASVLEDDFDRCFELGMNDVLTKPFSTELLLLALYNAVNGKPSTTSAPKKGDRVLADSRKVSDINILKIFCEEDPARIKKYIDIYLNSAPGTLAKMDKQLKQKDFNSLRITAHTFKTHLKYMGMDDTAFMARRLESLCEDGRDTEQIVKLLQRINDACLKSFDELKEYV